MRTGLSQTRPDTGILHAAFDVRYEFPVVFADDVLSGRDETIVQILHPHGSHRSRVVCVVDEGVAHLLEKVRAWAAEWSEQVELVCDLVVDGGERAKVGAAGELGQGVFSEVVQLLHRVGLDRHSYVLAIGGGAVLDAVGFAAAVVHRGVRVVRLPTTVLGQNDAGIGVKNAIDYQGAKNFLGTFSPPWAVINDFSLLSGLPPPAWRDGTAEAVKVGMIRDEQFFGWIEQNVEQLRNRDEGAFRWLIRRCAEIHLNQIMRGGDPFERGSARPLDFGHWAAHKLEQLSGFRISHGSAVASGMMIDTLYAVRAGMLSERVAARLGACLKGLGFELALGKAAGFLPNDLSVLMHGIEEFREHLGGELTLTFPVEVGRAVEVHQVDLDLMRDCVRRVLWE